MSVISKIISESLITFNSSSNIMSISSININEFTFMLDLNYDEDICDFVNIVDVFEGKLKNASIITSSGTIFSFNKNITGDISCNYVGYDPLNEKSDSITTVTCIDTFSDKTKEEMLYNLGAIKDMVGISAYYYE